MIGIENENCQNNNKKIMLKNFISLTIKFIIEKNKLKKQI
jgi:hypothetical protein